MLKAINLSAQYGTDPLFTGASFTVAPGERIGVVGPNGAGKSTLLRILADGLGPQTGHVEYGPRDRAGYAAQQVPDPAITIGAFLDDAPGELAGLARDLRTTSAALADPAAYATTLEQYATVMERYEQLGGWAYAARRDEIRDRLGVSHLPADATLAACSGGEQARLTLARVLLSDPTLLILDEPTNHLDADGIDWLGGFLRGFGGGVIVVTHDRAFLDRVATRIIELDGIHDEPQFYDGGYTAYRDEKQRRWERLLLTFEAQEKARARLAADIESTKNHALSVELTTRNSTLRRYAKKVAKKAKARERRLQRQMDAATWIGEPTTRAGLSLAFGAATAAEDREVVALHGVTAGHGDRILATDINLRVRAGDRVTITGANGTGKSTLLGYIAGTFAPPAGTRVATGTVAVLPQKHDDLRLDIGVLEFFRSRVPMYIDEAEDALATFMFGDDQLTSPIRTLSAGELRRLLIAVMVYERPDVIVLDEPTNFLDFDALDVVEEALRDYDGTLIVVTHDAYFAKAVRCDRPYVLADGRLSVG